MTRRKSETMFGPRKSRCVDFQRLPRGRLLDLLPRERAVHVLREVIPLALPRWHERGRGAGAPELAKRLRDAWKGFSTNFTLLEYASASAVHSTRIYITKNTKRNNQKKI